MRRIGLLVVVQLLLMFGVQAQPMNDKRLLVVHHARFSVEIPAAWKLLDQFLPGYGDETGYMAAYVETSAYETLGDACAAFSRALGLFGSEPVITEITIGGQPACKISPSEDQPERVEDFPTRRGIGLVIQYPTPFDILGQTAQFANVVIDADHFEAVSGTIDFDLAKVTSAAYLESALDFVQQYSYYTAELDWREIRIELLGRVSADDPLNTPSALLQELIRKMRRLGDNHSFYWLPEQALALMGTVPTQMDAPELPRGEKLDNGIGYLGLFTTLRVGGAEGENRYVAAAHEAIAAIDSPDMRCWMVDLRQDTGGSMDPMIISLAPILGDGAIGGFKNPDGDMISLTMQAGAIYQNGSRRSRNYVESIYTPQHPMPPIAVLIGNNTASAGENTLLALIGRPNTKTFGIPTAGLTVGNISLPLYDGALLGVASVASVDRNGTAYTEAIEPDEVVRVTAPTGGRDIVLDAASAWLLSLPACAG